MGESIQDARILVIDDAKASVLPVQQMLRSGGYTAVSTLLDCREAIATIERDPPDLLILDLCLAPTGGFALLDELSLRRGAERMPLVLMLTADETPAARAHSMGARAFVPKPVENVELLLGVRNLLEWRSLRGQLAPEQGREPHGAGEMLLEVLDRVQAVLDPAQRSYSALIASLGAALVRELGRDHAEAIRFEHAARLHDFGMLSLPESIRLSRAVLSAEQRIRLQTHTLAGAEMLDAAARAGLEQARNIALSHHERWDGAGYPYGLRGHEIPFEARVVNVAQVFISLTTDKPYRAALSPEEALAETRRMGGFALDPTVVQALTRCALARAVRPEGAAIS